MSRDGGGGKKGKRKKKGGAKGGKMSKGGGRGNTQTKAVMFVPFTKGSLLAKRMRESEQMLEKMSGYKLKVVERAGKKLEDILVQKNPWEGECCEREHCMLCETKTVEEKPKMKSCVKRNLVYRTWCQTCVVRDTLVGEGMEETSGGQGRVGQDGGQGDPMNPMDRGSGYGGQGDPMNPMVGGTGDGGQGDPMNPLVGGT